MNRNKNTAHVDSQTSERYFQFLFAKSHNGPCITYYVTTDPGGSPGWQTILFFGVQIKFTFIDHGTADCGGSPFYSAISGSGILQSLRELYREEKRFVPAANR